MGLHRIEATQVLPITVDEAWAFFADPRNLALLTPPEMRFDAPLGLPAVVREGMVVRYRMTPLLGVPVTWVAEFTHVEDSRLFVDEQRSGPYRYWQHQHRFRKAPGGVEVADTIHYDVGFGALGEVINACLVQPRLRAVFAFRRRALEERFGAVRSGNMGPRS